MASKYELITELADVTAKRITSGREEWTKYLKTAARLYRYPFREQMLIYAQRPDATAVASMEVWNNRMNCWVNRGSKGIALIDETRPRKLKYAFDVSNVHTEAGRGTGEQNDRADDEVRGRDRGTERPRPDGMGTQDELDPQQGGRSGSERDRLQPVVEVKYEQMTLFPSMAEQIGSIEAAEAGRKIPAPAAFSLSEEQIGEILRIGSGREHSRMRIYEKNREGHDPDYMADFLKKEYGIGGHSAAIPNDFFSHEEHSAKGLNMILG